MAGKPSPNVMKSLFPAIRISYILIIHAILSVGTVLLMIYFVDGKNANSTIGKRYQDGKTFLRVSDVTTIVSSALVLVRLVTSAWTTLSAWRCAFILLEKDGLSLKQFNRIASWHVPWPLWLWRSRHHLLATIVLVLLLPSIAVSPVLSGAVDWKSVSVSINAKLVPHIAGASDMWAVYLTDHLIRANVAMFAGDIANFAWWGSEGEDDTTFRHFIFNFTMPVGSTADNALLPRTTFHSLSWDETLEEGVYEALLHADSKISITGTQITGDSYREMTILFDLGGWNSPQLYKNAEFPTPSIFSGTKKVAIYLGEGVAGSGCSLGWMGRDNRADVPQGSVHLVPLGDTVSCYLIGTVNLTAGAVRSPSSVFILRDVIESKGELDFVPDPWAVEALFLLPDVVFNAGPMARLTLDDLTWDTIDSFVKKVIYQSYAGAWDALNYYMAEQPATNLTYHETVPMLQASVYFPRVWLWFFAQLLFTLSGTILLLLQSTCLHPVVTDGVAASLVVDSTNVPWVSGGGREDMSEAEKQAGSERKLHIKQRLESAEDPSSKRVAFSLVEYAEGNFQLTHNQINLLKAFTRYRTEQTSRLMAWRAIPHTCASEAVIPSHDAFNYAKIILAVGFGYFNHIFHLSWFAALCIRY